MFRVSMFALAMGLAVLNGGATGQETKKAAGQEVKKAETVKMKGFLPQNWAKIGLSDEQKQNIYRIQGKYGSEIDKLEGKIKELKSTRDQEMKAVLTPEQKKSLVDILTDKAK